MRLTIVPRCSSPSPDPRARSLVEDFALVVVLVRLAELVERLHVVRGDDVVHGVLLERQLGAGDLAVDLDPSFEAGFGVLRRERPPTETNDAER